jgi:protein-S-isoprenylcysteine O-methyltransferase
MGVLLILLPALGNPAVLHRAKLWIFLAIGLAATICQPGYSPIDSGPPEDRGTYLLIIWSLYGSQLAMILEANYLRYPVSFEWSSLTWVALAVSLCGLALRTWAVVTLGRFFTMHVRVLAGHQVIEEGPYRFLRHPSYVGALLLYLGTPLFFGASYTFAVVLLVLPPIFVRRVRVEEGLLVAALGEPYRRYMNRVGGLVPRW